MPALYVWYDYAIFCVFEKSSCHSPESEHVYIKFSPTFNGRAAERNCTMRSLQQFATFNFFIYCCSLLPSLSSRFNCNFLSHFFSLLSSLSRLTSSKCRLMSNKLIAEQSRLLSCCLAHESRNLFFPLSYFFSLQSSSSIQLKRVFSALLMYSINEKSFITTKNISLNDDDENRSHSIKSDPVNALALTHWLKTIVCVCQLYIESVNASMNFFLSHFFSFEFNSIT